LLCLI